MSKQNDPALELNDVLAAELRSWADPSRVKEAEPDVINRLHAAKPAALCLSGGGIRSATFGLGVLQGLARKGLLKEFDYISTVSGGGYIGSWLSSWIKRHKETTNKEWSASAQDVFDELAEGDETHSYPEGRFNEPDEITHLRAYSNYLTPKLGLLSVDSWTLAATYLRNLIVNWFVLVPFFLAVLALPRVWMSLLTFGAGIDVKEMAVMLGLAFISGLVLVIYLASVRPVPSDEHSTDEQRRSYGWRFALFGPAMLVLQALAMCYVRGKQDLGVGPDDTWRAATWGYMSRLPLGTTIAGWMQSAARRWNVDGLELLISLALSVVMLNLVGWTIYTIRLKRASATPIAKRAILELVGAVVAGCGAGFFLWLIILKMFPEPLKHVAAAPLHANQLVAEYFVCFAPALYLFAFFVQTMMFVGIAGKLNDDEDREWWARWAGWLLIVSVFLVALEAVAIFGPLLIAKMPKIIAALGGITGIITLTLGKSGASPATQGQRAEKSWKGTLTNVALALATPIFVIIVCSALSFLNTWLLHTALQVPGITASEASLVKPPLTLESAAVAHFALFRRTPFVTVGLYTLALFVLSFISSLFVHINRFSMHGLYRNRLTRAYLGASNADRHQNPFTGFDDHDNVFIEDLPSRPFHIINIALNLVGGDNLAWQERKAAPFTISPLHCGSSVLGYRPASAYNKPGGSRSITLGTAMAISGAAVSPNMGYHTSPALSFLLTLFNVRLGWWLRNPKKPESKSIAPSSSLMMILAEAFGKTDEESPWIYLSDGGHFENLGLYEMVRRRCHYIVVSDAGRDPKITFEDLGNAIRKIRIDLGIPINIEDAKIYPRDEKKPGRYYALGTIHYEVVDKTATPGMLVYLKPAIYGHEPIDIRNYASENVEFPHESTSDQWFTESQFESYRALGAFVVEEICKDPAVRSLKDFVDGLEPRAEAAQAARIPLKKEPLRGDDSPVVPGHLDVSVSGDRDVVE
jgi:hypothetical protein